MAPTTTTQTQIHEILTRKEAAAFLRISVRALDALVSAGTAPASFILGRGRMFPRLDVEAWIRRQIQAQGWSSRPATPPPASPGLAKRGRGRPRKAPIAQAATRRNSIPTHPQA
ncbi:helix-turn-helix transcriptional regulator [Nitrospirillum sp. BR 11752]|uniref:helix-turn-helix transcriptional regulator n=1 Tax=Nitrospirillum sp. BR 11752 TaxID=3104293 RepID=UPI003FA54E24